MSADPTGPNTPNGPSGAGGPSGPTGAGGPSAPFSTAAPQAALPPLVAPGPELTPEQARRYSRHAILPGIGIDGQRRLLAAKVLIIGAGGLDPRHCCTWRRRGSARSASSTTTWSRRRTCNAR